MRGLVVLILAMTKHADHPFSATLSSRDLALIGCLRALAEFCQQASNRRSFSEGKEENDWRAAGQKVTFCFETALDRDLFKNEVRRLLPANLVRFEVATTILPIERPVRKDSALIAIDRLT